MHSTIVVPNGPRPKPSLCRLRQKRKILPSDNLSVEKDFPRFYAKCRNRQSSDGNSDSETDSASRSISPTSSEEEYSSTKQRLCRLTDPMRDLLNEKHRLNSLTVEIHKLNKSYRHLIDINNNSVEDLQKEFKHRQVLEVESPLSSNMATCISINCWDDCLTGTKFGKLKSRLSQVSLSDSGYASNPDLTESTELLETKDICKNQCDSPPCEVSCGFESVNYGEFNVSHQPEKVVIQILPHDQNMPEIRKRPLSRCTMKINSEERLNDCFDYFSNRCIQTLDQCIQSECGSPNSVCSDTMQSSDLLDCFSCVSPVNEKKFLELCDPSRPLQVQSCPELSVSLETHHNHAQTSLEHIPSHKQVSRVTFRHDSNEDLIELLSHTCLVTDDESAKVTDRLSTLDVFLVQDSWLMFTEGDRPTSGKVPYVIFAHKKGDEPRGRWALMQEVLSENGKSRMKSLSVQN